ncbi:MAG: cupin domain-containing protein [Deltaproteobacteria bacterium]|nr:cupin domain-containing protein [Deltaproteobacteria bacterium]
MKKITLKDVKPYSAPGHFDMTALRLHGKEETGATKFWIGLSYFLPGGGADFASPPGEKVYFVIDGEVTIKTEDQETVLVKNDLIYIAPNEGRAIINESNRPVSMLVVYSYD